MSKDKPSIIITDRTERVVMINMTFEQVKEAMFMWLCLQGISLPSANIDDYRITIPGSDQYSGYFSYRDSPPDK